MFAILTGGVLLALAAVVLVLSLSADFLTKYIPFRYELDLAQPIERQFNKPHSFDEVLVPLGDKLAAAMELPEDVRLSVHYSDEDVVNAFASFGGHVVIYRGLVEKLESENALAMVLAHEIAHIKHRHPIRSLGRGVVVMLALLALAGVQGGDLVGNVISGAGSLTLLGFSRAQENEADATALAAVQRVYGHTAGALQLYEVLLDEHGETGKNLPVFLSSHPLTTERIINLRALAGERGWPDIGEITALQR